MRVMNIGETDPKLRGATAGDVKTFSEVKDDATPNRQLTLCRPRFQLSVA